ncbi:MAG TPA: orotate phosphoribosyltransferase [Pyrinomonadaceae bacterium]|nr:orotate phosphoribosyltransferase [Pyrinomonadaceae bacterium]
MRAEEVLQKFKDTGALLEGHFILSSGLHSETYLQCALVLQYPEVAEILGAAIATNFSDGDISLVAAPAIGGLIIGHEVARALKARFIWTERENGVMTLRRGFSVTPGERTLVVEDVVTTGGSTRETIAALVNAGADVIAAASIIDRSAGVANVGVARVSLATLNVMSLPADQCPLCRAGVPTAKPGSRSIGLR